MKSFTKDKNKLKKIKSFFYRHHRPENLNSDKNSLFKYLVVLGHVFKIWKEKDKIHMIKTTQDKYHAYCATESPFSEVLDQLSSKDAKLITKILNFRLPSY